MDAPAGRKTAYLHIGTHKTGTTSLQAFLCLNEAALGAAGIYIPHACRPVSKGGNLQFGHHNLAWQLNDIGLYSPEEGTADQLFAEIARVAPPTVVISSEDLEWLHGKPEVLRALAARFDAIGYDVRVVLYLRNQAEYIQAIYIEGSKSGFLMNYAAVLGEILDRGTFEPDPRVINRFEYGPLVDAYARAFGSDRMIVKGYDPRQPSDALLKEFFGMIGGNVPSFDRRVKPPALNASPSILHVLSGMYKTVVAADPAASDPQTILRETFPGQDVGVFMQKFDVMTREETRQVFERFRDDNRRIEERYGAHVPFQSESDLRDADSPHWAVVEKHRALLDAATRRWKI